MWAVVGLGFYSGTSINIKKLRVMKQTEFEQKLIELKNEDKELINDYKRQVLMLNEEQAEINKVINKLTGDVKEIKRKKAALSAMVQKLESRRSEKVQKFKQENWSEERKLSEVSDWCLVNELVARGFSGTITNDEKDTEFMTNLSKKFASGKFITPPILDELHNDVSDGEQIDNNYEENHV